MRDSELTKPALRSFVRQLKAEHQGSFAAWSAEIAERVMQTSLWQSAGTVLLYHALPDEPDLQSLLDKGLMQGKQVLLPVVEGDDLVLRRYTGKDSLCEGAFHILEPNGEDFPVSCYGEVGLVIVPGMAFDIDGHRLGRGRGYYDRLLPRLRCAYKLGVCFPFQLLDAIPYEPHDIKMDEVVRL